MHGLHMAGEALAMWNGAPAFQGLPCAPMTERVPEQ